MYMVRGFSYTPELQEEQMMMPQTSHRLMASQLACYLILLQSYKLGVLLFCVLCGEEMTFYGRSQLAYVLGDATQALPTEGQVDMRGLCKWEKFGCKAVYSVRKDGAERDRKSH
jgi:hypothetical protein